MKKFLNNISDRFASLRKDENGMEVAQVILILVLVVGLLVVIVPNILSAISGKASSASSLINK